jgi:hypothetical protein
VSIRGIENDDDLESAWTLYSDAREELDEITTQKTSLQSGAEDEIWGEEEHVRLFSNLCSLAEMLAGYDSTAYGSELSEISGVSGPLLNKLLKRTGSIKLGSASRVLDQFKLILARAEADMSAEEGPNSSEEEPKPKETGALEEVSTTRVQTEQWVVPSPDERTRELINDLIRCLEGIITEFSQSNSFAADKSLNELRMEELKAVLRTALNVLESPLVERGILKKTADVAKAAAGEIAKDEFKTGLGKLLSIAGEKALELYIRLQN